MSSHATDTDTDPYPTTPRGVTPVRAAHLSLGVTFLAWALVWTLLVLDVVGTGDLDWLLPLPFILGGLAGLAPALSARRRRAPA